MADAPTASESPAQEKARLRRERRAAKIAAGGAERLQAISALQGGSHRDVVKDVPAKPSPSPRPRPTASGADTPDPEDVDISQHHYTPASQPRQPSPFAFGRNDTPTPPMFPAPGQAQDPTADHLMAMMQQMMGSGGIPEGPGQPGAPSDLPPGLANLFSAMSGSSIPEPAPEQSSAWIWRLVHSLFSLGLAIYIVLRTPFTGTKLSRTAAPGDDWMHEGVRGDGFAHFFYLFATFEVVLQSSRFFIEQGRLQGNGILSTIGGFLPEPYAGYVRLVGRYSVIYSTVVSDAMVIVFVLGAAHWWNGDVLARASGRIPSSPGNSITTMSTHRLPRLHEQRSTYQMMNAWHHSQHLPQRGVQTGDGCLHCPTGVLGSNAKHIGFRVGTLP